ncbi:MULTISPECIES: NAD-dependent epimerase/dehydratase family protein [unclassified Exiguobacterium]|uniref:polysaccharide biosynthesis C-terminal domain-containing protein n=1 Tax=unclassified Exiguobacterium TaxID=2644629 RepID=UPI001BEC1C38|nr:MULTISPECIES: NAD-dependent epimerase/dehydratase family protein [unclassified Exiguobacterium]
MNILVTGANGFIGKNLVAELNNRGYKNVFKVTRETDWATLNEYTKKCDFVFHLAGVNRSENENDFMEGNHDFTSELLNLLKNNNNMVPVLSCSSIQAERDNLYGISKRAGERLLSNYSSEYGVNVYIYRLPNLYGKWSRPDYNSVIATFCYRISRDLEISVDNPEAELNIAYIDDVLSEFINALEGKPTKVKEFCIIPNTHKIKVGDLAHIINGFKESRETLVVPNTNNDLIKTLYSTYLSFLPQECFSYDLKMNIDFRGSFTEFLKLDERGQVSVNVSKPGITKGNHWHHTKNEKFLVVSGKGIVRLRNINSNEIIEYEVCGEKLQVIDIPTGYTHSIENVSEIDLVTIMWANEYFDQNRPDTYYLEV